MIHTKLLLQRLAYVAWLLAAWWTLGGAGQAAAQTEKFALSVNKDKVREDAGATDIEVTVEVTDDVAVDADTVVLLGISQSQAGLNSRFSIQLVVLRIPAGEKRATGTITFIPINDGVVNNDLPIEINGNAGNKAVRSTQITLIDDDKTSANINLSADKIELNRLDGATAIVVTATLDGKALKEDTSFALIIGDHPSLTDEPNADTNGDGAIDDADATKDNREAQRDVDYTVTLATLTIPRNAVAGTATITIDPSNRLPGTIRLGSPDYDAATDGIQTAGSGLTVHPVDIKIKKEAAAKADTVTLSQESVREDAGATTIELKVTLTAPTSESETVQLVILSSGSVLPSGDVVQNTPTRDVHYTLSFGPPLTIPPGATEGTTSFTLTPVNDNAAIVRNPIYMQVAVGGAVAVKTIAIVDDDATSTQIALTVNPTEISEGAGSVDVEVTGTLDGKVLDSAAIVFLTIDPLPDGAVRDVDYTATLRPLVIAAGEVSGTATITIRPIADDLEDDGEKIRLTVPNASGQVTTDSGTLTVGTVDITLKDGGDVDSIPAFAGASIADQVYAQNEAIGAVQLPSATGGDGSLTYGLTPALPTGLSFDAQTRSLAGTPTAAFAAAQFTYTATDSDGDTATLTFSIAVDPAVVSPAGLAFAEGTAIDAQTYTVGVEIDDLVLPAVEVTDCKPAYSVSALPAGLWFNSATRTLAGTPTHATDGILIVTYTATDIDLGQSAVLLFAIEVLPVGQVPKAMAAALTATPAEVDEDGGVTAITLTFALTAAAAADENVQFSLVDPSEGAAAQRDVDYRAELESNMVIPAGATEVTATLTLTPINDSNAEGLEAIGVQAVLVSTGQTLSTDLVIRDDDAPSTAIVLMAEPNMLSENASLTVVLLTATLNGKPLSADAEVNLAIDASSTATRNVDYAVLFNPVLEIPAGSPTGTLRFYIDPVADNVEEGDEFVRLTGTIDGLEGDSVEIVLSDPGSAKTAVQPRPAAFSLADNYPNPFNPATTIHYALPQAADVKLTVYNVVGQPVRTLVAAHQGAGRYAVEWNATDDSGHSLSAGMYFYHLRAGEFRQVKKMLLVK